MTPREELLQAAAAEFAEKGYAGTSFNSIGERLGKSRSYVQHYARSKAELAEAVAFAPYVGDDFLLDTSMLTGGQRMILRLVETTGDRYATDVMVRASTRLMFERDQVDGVDLPVPYIAWVGPLTQLLAEAVEDGDVDHAVDISTLAWRITAAFAGAKLLCETMGELDLLAPRAVATVSDLLRAHRP